MLAQRVRIITCLFSIILSLTDAPPLPRAGVAQTASLSCSCLEGKDGIGMMITRSDLPQGQYVILVRDNRSDTAHQNEAFHGRVQWTGNWSVDLQDVTSSDRGHYTCQGFYKDQGEENMDVKCSICPTITVSAVIGQTANLPCWCLDDKNGVGMKISRSDMPKDQYVIFIRDNRSDPAQQNYNYSDRMEWTGAWNANILKVTDSDMGTYMCQGFYRGPDNETETTECAINLKDKGGWNIWVPIAIVIFAFIVLILPIRLGFFLKSRSSGHQSDDGDSVTKSSISSHPSVIYTACPVQTKEGLEPQPAVLILEAGRTL